MKTEHWLTAVLIFTAVPLLAEQTAGAPAPSLGSGLQGDDIATVVRALDVPAIKLPLRTPLAPEEIAQIKQHIANLALIDRPDMGLASNYTGTAFAPVPQVSSVGMMLLGSAQPKTSGDFVELVKLGPKALPFLLEALDDRTPTKLVLGQPIGSHSNEIFGGMFRRNEIRGNPANAAERTAIGPKPPHASEDLDLGESVRDQRHIVTVGDVCFVIIGQITNRPSYRASRYQPTAISIINSPTDDPELVKQIRSIWSASEPEQHLMDFLLLDFSTTVNLPENASQELRQRAFGVAWQFPIGATMRLLYYFPNETGDLIAQLIAGKAEDKDLLEAVAWSKHPAVRSQVTKIFRETKDPMVLLTCLSAVDEKDNDLVLQRILSLIDALKLPPDIADKEPFGPFDEGYMLVLAAGKRLGAASKSVYLRYSEQPTFNRRVALCSAIQARPEWAVEFLAPLLDDTREERMWYQVVEGNDQNRLAIRVCDDAARAINLSRPDLPFVLHGTHVDLDRQIAVMKRLIAKTVPSKPADPTQSSLPGS